MDTFAATAARTGIFRIALCSGTCLFGIQGGVQGDILDVAIGYFNILDQFGNVLTSSQGDNVSGNYREINFDAGVLYYIMVLAEDTMNQTQGYSIGALQDIP